MNGWLWVAVVVFAWIGLAFLLSMWVGTRVRVARVQEVSRLVAQYGIQKGPGISKSYSEEVEYFLAMTKKI